MSAGLAYDQRLYLEEQARERASRPEPEPHQFEAAADALREAQMVERLALLRISRARKAHVAEMEAHPYQDGGMDFLFKIDGALSTARALVKEQQKLLTAPCHVPFCNSVGKPIPSKPAGVANIPTIR